MTSIPKSVYKAPVRTHLVAFIWVDRKRFKDADCVSVGCSNLKIKSCVHHHNITHPISASAQSLPQEKGKVGCGAGEQDGKEVRDRCKQAKNVPLSARHY